MKVGIMPLFGGETAEPSYISRIVQRMEGQGFHSLWAVDHILIPTEIKSDYPYAADGSFPVDATLLGLEPFNLLSFIAAQTTTLRLGTGVVVLPQREPRLVAKCAADLDVLSGGRFDFGIGVGWLAEEFHALDMPFERRGSRADDYIRLMREIWQSDVSKYAGEFIDMPPVQQYPKPVQKPHPPLYFGGESNPALRRVARFGHWYGVDVMPDQVAEKKALLQAHCEREGRALDDVKIALCPYANPCDKDTLRRYEDAGVDQVIVAAFVPGKDAMEKAIDTYAEQLLG